METKTIDNVIYEVVQKDISLITVMHQMEVHPELIADDGNSIYTSLEDVWEAGEAFDYDEAIDKTWGLLMQPNDAQSLEDELCADGKVIDIPKILSRYNITRKPEKDDDEHKLSAGTIFGG